MAPEMDDKNFRIFFILLCPGSSAHLYGDGDIVGSLQSKCWGGTRDVFAHNIIINYISGDL